MLATSITTAQSLGSVGLRHPCPLILRLLVRFRQEPCVAVDAVIPARVWYHAMWMRWKAPALIEDSVLLRVYQTICCISDSVVYQRWYFLLDNFIFP